MSVDETHRPPEVGVYTGVCLHSRGSESYVPHPNDPGEVPTGR